jgi:predicted hotdog family 3-hydroxylacyl-ACP dehydratase
MSEPYLPVELYLPHRSPMVLVDRLVSDDGEGVVVETVVRPDGLFVVDGAMPAWVGLELMAQAIGVFAGRRSREREEEVRLGFLLGTRRFTAQVDGFPVGARLTVEARMEIVSEQGLAVFKCRILHEGVEVADALMNVFQPNDVEGYLKEALGV